MLKCDPSSSEAYRTARKKLIRKQLCEISTASLDPVRTADSVSRPEFQELNEGNGYLDNRKNDEETGEPGDEPLLMPGKKQIVYDNERREKEKRLTQAVEVFKNAEPFRGIHEGNGRNQEKNQQRPDDVGVPVAPDGEKRHQKHQPIAREHHHPDRPFLSWNDHGGQEARDGTEHEDGEEKADFKSHGCVDIPRDSIQYPSFVGWYIKKKVAVPSN